MSAQAAPGRLLSRLWTTGAADAPAQAASPAKAERTLRFCSFNVLADGLAQHGEWANAAAPDLEWDQRWPQLQQEVLRADADVVGLAECNNFSSHWRTFFEQQGYDGIFAPKDSSPASRFGAQPDGVALFWRRALFDTVQTHTRSALKPPCAAALLRHKALSYNLQVSMTHLKAGHDHADTRQQQVADLTPWLESIFAESKDRQVFMGDLNAEADEPCVSALQDAGLKPAFQLGWTTWKERNSTSSKRGVVKHTIDYILVSEKWTLRHFLLEPEDPTLTASGLPLPAHASDHIALVCDLEAEA